MGWYAPLKTTFPFIVLILVYNPDPIHVVNSSIDIWFSQRVGKSYGLPVEQFGTCSPTNHRMAGPLVCYFIAYKMFSANQLRHRLKWWMGRRQHWATKRFPAAASKLFLFLCSLTSATKNGCSRHDDVFFLWLTSFQNPSVHQLYIEVPL